MMNGVRASHYQRLNQCFAWPSKPHKGMPDYTPQDATSARSKYQPRTFQIQSDTQILGYSAYALPNSRLGFQH